ncbi:MAG TPA: hypothetical protein VF443_05025 [Nitrospira sp.]
MKRCTHPESALHWNAKDEVFVCHHCGQFIFPVPVNAPEDDFDQLDESLCWRCGGTGINGDGNPCEACMGEGYVSEEI